ncbi:hypothetical protein AWH56_009990 [Anaerobacillus isosaccharinicus]|uniref:Proteinase inhibitor I42 chagasin domain-containing protein n=1 Tax=Anaerobacillus isosaccharinicus TaxID=1532552 RepID=A0A1S2L510_9BACI|nr:hypothetical protein [Anaerobacillus isosaccharinicus]MBA5588741.1 hypothetical protein [Anaerobacillus isosaccharinicus]QOY37859.1 hypothetical protein AWH56_009990 [Anaerobacillus isosaccharinicus]
MTIRLISIAILSSFLFIVGCSQTQVDNIDLKTERSMNEDFPPRITGYVEANGVQFEMEQGGFNWKTKDQAVITDAASPNQIAERFDALAPKTELSIQLEGQPYILVYLWEEEHRGKEVLLNNNRFSVPEIQGRYIYEVVANWSSYGSDNARGEVSYTFVIEVE